MFSKLFSKNFQRKSILKKTTSPVIKEYLSKPFPEKRKKINELDIVSVDIETTGLDSEKDQILSIGLVKIEKLGINLSTSWHQLVTTQKAIPEKSVVVHQITDDESAGGKPLEDVMALFLGQLSGKVMLVHNANIEQSFFNKACQSLYGNDFVVPIIDTQVLAKRSLERMDIPYKNNELRLFNLRSRFNMPAYRAHNALLDAIATAELFLALLGEISPRKDVKLSELLS